jgi:hypothetical protein
MKENNLPPHDNENENPDQFWFDQVVDIDRKPSVPYAPFTKKKADMKFSYQLFKNA